MPNIAKFYRTDNSPYLLELDGLHGIKAKLLASSINSDGVRMDTFELEYPRQVHAEVRTHGMVDMNSSSSRAIPAKFMRNHIWENTARPVVLTKNQAGMQGKELHDGLIPVELIADVNKLTLKEVLKHFEVCEVDTSTGYVTFDEFTRHWALSQTLANHEVMERVGLHKQVVNRYCEPFQFMKVVFSATELDNFFNLRFQEDADPTLIELVNCMLALYHEVTPEVLSSGEWHTPYVQHARDVETGELEYFVGQVGEGDFQWLTPEDAIKVSCCACAQVSYRKMDTSPEKVARVFDLLINGGIIHGSAFAHVATPMKVANLGKVLGTQCNIGVLPESWEAGVTHMDRSGQLWSAKLRGWVQYRKLIPNENCESFDYESRKQEVYGTVVGSQLTQVEGGF